MNQDEVVASHDQRWKRDSFDERKVLSRNRFDAPIREDSVDDKVVQFSLIKLALTNRKDSVALTQLYSRMVAPLDHRRAVSK